MFFKKRLISKSDEQHIVAAIAAAEQHTSGEIRVHVDNKCAGEPYPQAVALFEKIGMTATKDRNGILIYIAASSKQFAIIGDTGINEKVPADFWNQTAAKMSEQFRAGRIADGIVAAVTDAGLRLKKYFPRQRDDRNELTNDVSFS